MTPLDRLLAHMIVTPGPLTTPCWLSTYWLRYDGYTLVSVANRKKFAHRVAYEGIIGPIPEGLELDHLCRIRHCVNPDHLEPVTPTENVHRSNAPTAILHRLGTCLRGHDLTDVYVYPPESKRAGKWQCRICVREWRTERPRQ